MPLTLNRQGGFGLAFGQINNVENPKCTVLIAGKKSHLKLSIAQAVGSLIMPPAALKAAQLWFFWPFSLVAWVFIVFMSARQVPA